MKAQLFGFIALLLLIIPVVGNAAEAQAGHKLVILHTKDLHGRFLEHNEQDKSLAALMSAFFKSTKAENENVLTLDTGNYSPNFQYAKIADRAAIVTLMGKMGYDALNIGSHEIDEGIKHFYEMVKAAQIPLLSENIEFTKPDSTNAKVKPYIIKELHGLKVGVIGLVGSDYTTHYIKDKNFRITSPNERGRLAKLVQELAAQTDVIIILANAGIDNILEATDMLPSNVVVLVGWGVANGEYNFRANRVPGRTNSPLYLFTHSDDINQLNLTVSNKQITEYSLVTKKIAELKQEDAQIAQETAQLIEKRQQYYRQNAGTILNDIDARRVAVSNFPTNAISLLAQPIREKWKDVDCVIINSGAIYSYQDDIIKAGPISIGAIAELYPFMNTVVIARVLGRDIKSMLERSSSAATFSNQAKSFTVHQMRSFLQSSGLAYTLDFSQTSQLLSEDDKQIIREGNRVRSISINQKPLDLDKYYTVATNDYVFGGGDGYVQFKYAKDVIKTDIQIQDLMLDYLKRHSPVGLQAPDYIIFLNRKDTDYQQVGPPNN